MLRNILISLVLFAFFPLPPKAQAAEKVRVTKLPNSLEVHEYRLKNGLQVLIVPDHTAPVFTFQAWERVGSADEKLDPRLRRTGLAHFFEHMMFRGTKKVPDFDKTTSLLGKNGDNATTSYDRTNFFESVPKERLDKILEIEADRATNLIVNKKYFDAERGAVLGEYKMGLDKPQTIAHNTITDLAFEVSPYKYTIIGTEAEIKGFTVEDARYFYKTYYAPNNATLILLGDLDPAKTIALVEKHYGKMKSQDIPDRLPPEEPPQTAPRRKEVTHPLARNDLLMLAYHVPGMAHPDTASFEAIEAVLSYGESSILEQELVAAGYATSVAAYTYGLRLPQILIVQVNIAPEKDPAQVEKIVRNAVDRIAAGKLSEKEFVRGKNQYLMQAYTQIRSLPVVGDFLGESLRSGNYLRAFDLLEEVKKLTPADLSRVAAKYLTLNNSSLVLVRPGKK